MVTTQRKHREREKVQNIQRDRGVMIKWCLIPMHKYGHLNKRIPKLSVIK